MYCDEPILNVWYLEPIDNDDYNWWYFDNIFQFDLYAAGESRLVFQTENHYITLGADGVKTWKDKEEFVTSNLDLYNYDNWYDDFPEMKATEPAVLSEEMLYFQGERILDVSEKEDGWQIQFDHLTMMLHPRTEKDQPWSSYYNFLPSGNLDHKLKRCRCGGKARLLGDQVDDWYICCDTCFRSTDADYRLAVVVKSWNNDDCPYENDHTPFECFFMRKDKTIRDIFIPRNTRHLGPDHISCDGPILQFDDTGFELTSLFVPEARCIFNIIYQVSGFNPEVWPKRIELDEGEDGFRFVSLERGDDHEVMTLTTGKRDVVITAECFGLDIVIVRKE